MTRVQCIIFLTCQFILNNTFACAPSMHAFIAELWLDTYQVKDEANRKAMIIGALFPDIRYLGKVSRAQTHTKNVSLKQINDATDYFEKGKLLHAYVDEQHALFLRQYSLSLLLPPTILNQKKLYLELVLDEIIYNEEWGEQISKIISRSISQEKILNLNDLDLFQWHSLLTIYFTNYPSAHLKKLTLFNRDIWFLDATTIQLWSDMLQKSTQNPYFKDYARDLILFFKSRFVI